MNWNPAYSYATIPPGITDYPAYWKVLTTPVPDAQGRAHFHDVHIWNIKATGATTAFEVSAFPAGPPRPVSPSTTSRSRPSTPATSTTPATGASPASP